MGLNVLCLYRNDIKYLKAKPLAISTYETYRIRNFHQLSPSEL